MASKPLHYDHLLGLLAVAVLDERDAVREVEVEVEEGPVLLAEGLQGAAVDLRGQVLEEEPGAGLALARSRRGSARHLPVSSVAPAGAGAESVAGRPAGGGGGLLLPRHRGAGLAPQVLAHRGQVCGAGTGRQAGVTPGLLLAGVRVLAGGRVEAPGAGGEAEAVLGGGDGAGGLGGHAARGQGGVLAGVLQGGALPGLARHELGDAEVVLLASARVDGLVSLAARPPGVSVHVAPGPVILQQEVGAGLGVGGPA